MGVKIKGLTKLNSKLRRVGKAVAEPSNADMLKIGFRVMDAIKQRTASGRDKDGRAFAPYADGTRRKKRGGGWLHDTGRMMSAMTTKANRGSVTVFFRGKGRKGIDENQKALVHQRGLGHMPQREFFGLTSKDERKIVERVLSPIRKAIRR